MKKTGLVALALVVMTTVATAVVGCGSDGSTSADGSTQSPGEDSGTAGDAGNGSGDASTSEDGGKGAAQDAAGDAKAHVDAGADAGGIVPGAPIQFEVGRTYGAMFSSKVVIVDVTGDGLPDLVGLDHWDDFIYVKPGDGKGTFATAAITTAHNHLQQDAFIVADYDRDGDQDVALPKGTALDWFLNDGTGKFAAGPSTSVGTFDQVVIGDVTGDGLPDVVAANYGGVAVYKGLAAGGFSATAVSSQCLTAGTNMQLGDFDGDGHVDAAMGAGSVAICRGNGAGSFAATAASTYAGAPGATLYASVPGATGKRTLYLLGTQTVTAFDDIQGSALVGSATITSDSPHNLLLGAADFTGDGKADVLLGTFDGGSDYTLRVYARQGGAFTRLGTYDWSGGDAALGDVNGDKTIDVVHNEGFEAVVMRGRGDGTLRAAPKWELGAQGSCANIVDVTGDGRPDIIACSGTVIEAIVAQPSGTPVALPSFALSTAFTALRLADMNGDGHVDLLFSHRTPDGLDLLPGDGTGHFGAAVSLGSVGNTFEVGDLDADGKPDLVQDALPGLRMRLGKTGTWQPVPGLPDYIGWHLLRDVDGDGKVDLLALSDDGMTQALHFLKGHGDGTFDADVTTPQSAGYGVDLADLDGDGDLDSVTAVGGVSAFLFNAGHFAAPIVTTDAKLMYLRDLALADFDNDGHMDVVYSGGYGMVVLRGDGTGHFATAFTFATQYVDTLAVGDIDQDGRIDWVGNAEGVWYGRNISGLP